MFAAPRSVLLRAGTAMFLAAAALGAASHPMAETKTPAAAEKTIEGALEGAQLVGKGMFSAYTKGDATLLVLPAASFDRLFLWYAEVVSVPTNVVGFLNLGTAVMQMERHGHVVFIRDLTGSFDKRAGRQDPRPGQTQGPEINPIDIAVRRGNEAPIVAELPILATGGDGSVLVDVTRMFSGDIETLSAMPQVIKAGLIPAAVNPVRSYITSTRVFPENLVVRTHLTFMAKDAKNPATPLRGVSMRVSHSLVQLPDKPMAGRDFDPRVGFFFTRFTEYQGEGNRAAQARALINRFRLEKKDPSAPVSDPVKPITYYIGREVPDQWRPFIKAGIEMWRPAFEAAGFSNAIVALDAPSFKDDPNWTPEDARFNTVRWLAQPNANARGPQTVDPRSGEIISAHIEVWPQVMTVFGRYYFSVASALDPKANSLPLSEEVQGRLLQYIVAHEVGHTIGLRHNHVASTAYTVAQMRNAEFANRWGANASIMAYGRFNQAAQPGDGVTKLIPGLGPYDFFVINWGYGSHGKTEAEERKALDRLAAKSESERTLLWAASELPEEMAQWLLDPRVQRENTGADRVEATRLGVANILRALRGLDAATRGDNAEFVGAFAQMQSHHMTFLKSVAAVVGGVETRPHAKTGPTTRVLPAGEQRAAVRYLLGAGAMSLSAYAAPEFGTRVNAAGTLQSIELLQASLVATLLDGSKLTVLDLQKAADAKAYGPLDFAQDSYDAVWSDLAVAPRWRRTLQRAYLARLGALFKDQAVDPAKREAAIKALTAEGFSQVFAELATANGGETVFPAWAREMLPRLGARLETAANGARDLSDRLHFKAMAAAARHVLEQAK